MGVTNETGIKPVHITGTTGRVDKAAESSTGVSRKNGSKKFGATFAKETSAEMKDSQLESV